jgi:hypothetical protein
MGFDLTITKGSLRLSEARMVIRELIEFATQMELEIIPVNWMVSGMIADMPDVFREMRSDYPDFAEPLVSRPIVKVTEMQGSKQRWFSIENEHVQGLVFCHHYEEWILTWNVSRGGILGKYYHVLENPTPTRSFFDPQQAISPKQLLPTIDDFLNLEPIEVHGEFGEDHLGIHCPWRQSDAAAACDVVKLLARHSDGLEARDDMGIWPNKDFTKWRNSAEKYAKMLGGEPMHPDALNELRSNDLDQD